MKSQPKSLVRFAVLALSLGLAHLAGADTPPVPASNAVPQLPALQVTPGVLGSDGVVTLTLPPDYPLSNTRLRIGLFEHGRPVLVTDALREFSLREGRLQTSLTLQADPGAYDIRLISNDRARAPFSAPAPLLVPGIDREPGWWLLNGTPIQNGAGKSTPAAATAPLFITGLTRDLGKKPKAVSANVAGVSATPLEWKTFSLPSLRNMLDTANFDFTRFRTSLEKQLQEAKTAGQRNFIGFQLDTGSEETPLPANVSDTIKTLRQTLNAVAPGAALILHVDANRSPALAVRDIDACAALCDAVAIVLPRFFHDRWAWPLKAARRVTEEQPNYDLPIFVEASGVGDGTINPFTRADSLSNLDYWMSGATGILSNAGDPGVAWGQTVQRNLPLFVGSVTLEDIGILPTPDDADARGRTTVQLYGAFRSAGRVPLLARALHGTGIKSSESFAVALGDRLSDAAVQQFKAAVSGGGQIYIEGAPVLDEKGQPLWKLGTLVGATATAIPTKRTTMVLEDPWVFGFGRGAHLEVDQTVTVTMNPEAAPSKIKPEKGKDVLTGPRVVARLQDGSPAVIIIPVGQGEIIWTPHRMVFDSSTPPAKAPAGSTASTPLQRYYSAIAGYLQSGLVDVQGTDAQQASASEVRVAVRRSAKGTLLVAVLNPTGRPAPLAITAKGIAGVALDLDTQTELPLKQRGFEVEAKVPVPAQGWKIVAFATSRKLLDDERSARRLNARIR